jgi:hypothetical protein
LNKIRGAGAPFGGLFSSRASHQTGSLSITAEITKNGVVIEYDSRAFESTLGNVFRLLSFVNVRKCHEEGFTT